MSGGADEFLHMNNHKKEWLAQCQAELVSLPYLHKLDMEPLAQDQAALISLLHMLKHNSVMGPGVS